MDLYFNRAGADWDAIPNAVKGAVAINGIEEAKREVRSLGARALLADREERKVIKRKLVLLGSLASSPRAKTIYINAAKAISLKGRPLRVSNGVRK